MQKVTVPAGSYDALRISESVSMSYGAAVSWVSSTNWLAEGVGLIKEVSTDGQGHRTTMELTDVARPE
jgi:hypothetical protein